MASLSPLLGVMKFEYDPLTLDSGSRLGWLALEWLQDAGGFAMVGLALWVRNGLRNPIYDIGPDGKKKNRLVGPNMLLLGAIALTIYLIALGLQILVSNETNITPRTPFWGRPLSRIGLAFEISLALAGLVALIGFGGPFVVDCFKLRFRRVYALSRLSFQEAVRRRVVWVFLGILILYLFPARWFFNEKPEDEIKSIVGVTTRGMNVLLIAVSLLLASFSIPNDIKNLTIHTIVTKPVERFEVVLGRFFGYLGLVTLALLMMTGFGLLLINFGNVSPEAEEESLKARVARYGKLDFRSRSNADFRGTDVGREDVYRKYIAGGQNTPQRAVWNFDIIPSRFAKADVVPLEFAFDIYRTTKGEEGAGVSVSFEIVTQNWDPNRRFGDLRAEDAYKQETLALGTNPRKENTQAWARVNEIAEKYGRFTYSGKQIFDYHTTDVAVPGGLFRNADKDERSVDGSAKPARQIQVQIRCDTPSQFVGAAQYDLYFLESEGNFSLNYFKGSAGLWFRLVIAIALSVACSTYLAGVLSFLIALFLFVAGFFRDFILMTAFGLNVGGGPLESLVKLIKNSTATIDLDPTPTVKALQLFDGVWRWALRRVMNVIPDVDRYGMSEYVAEGFDIAPGFLLLNLITITAYVLPWLVAAYYLMKAREVAA